MRGHPDSSSAQGVSQTWRGDWEGETASSTITSALTVIEKLGRQSSLRIFQSSCLTFTIMRFISDDCSRNEIRMYGLQERVPATYKHRVRRGLKDVLVIKSILRLHLCQTLWVDLSDMCAFLWQKWFSLDGKLKVTRSKHWNPTAIALTASQHKPHSVHQSKNIVAETVMQRLQHIAADNNWHLEKGYFYL